MKSESNLPTLPEDKVANLFVDERGRLHVTASGSVGSIPSSSAPTSLAEFSVPTGTATAIGATTSATRSILVQAPLANTIAVYVGGSGVTTSTGIELLPGDAVTLATTNAASVYGIAASTGQKLRILVL
ncbi:hypothetical protein BE21_57450 [Sorangium cellulosum]|uniref:Uncharacterized protein n=1 Tax=Sorangium cellulosum TaxID=56 RepID=A0A150U3P4_SORCE|nr:hypothetical protein BE21_57450 [Sorangium cellulosum]